MTAKRKNILGFNQALGGKGGKGKGKGKGSYGKGKGSYGKGGGPPTGQFGTGRHLSDPAELTPWASSRSSEPAVAEQAAGILRKHSASASAEVRAAASHSPS